VQTIENRIFSIQNEAQFESVALEVYAYQSKNCEVYKKYIEALNRPEPTNLLQIPFLPIGFFKTHEVKTKGIPVEFTFVSSGTTGQLRSQHPVQYKTIYERSFLQTYRDYIGDPAEQIILALLPNYIDQGNSSLVYMVDHLIKLSTSPLSGFYLSNYDDLLKNYREALHQGKKIVIFGVSYALLDLAEKQVDLSAALIIETGGMKGRRKEMTKEELHATLKKGLHCDTISSEYGMTELFSQAYSNADGLFDLPSTMEVLIRDIEDPFCYLENGKTGGLNIVDLSNLYSCSFIETQDLGKRIGTQFQLMGRFDNSDIRGCNLLVE
jgi:phenylacetate-coenzyme A ligase PaaK-like adenylate-forming protein